MQHALNNGYLEKHQQLHYLSDSARKSLQKLLPNASKSKTQVEDGDLLGS